MLNLNLMAGIITLMTASWPDGMMKTWIYPVKGLLTLYGYPTLFLQCNQTGRTERSLFGISLCLTPAGLPRKNAPRVVVVIPNTRCARRIASLESQPEGTESFVVRRIPATHPFGAYAKIYFSPQKTEESASNRLSLATIDQVRQAPGKTRMKKTEQLNTMRCH
jgi:hypothetical protein